jgi:hypothetical protein
VNKIEGMIRKTMGSMKSIQSNRIFKIIILNVVLAVLLNSSIFLIYRESLILQSEIEAQRRSTNVKDSDLK